MLHYFDVTLVSQDMTMCDFVAALRRAGFHVQDAAPVHQTGRLLVIVSKEPIEKPKEPEPREESEVGPVNLEGLEPDTLGWTVNEPGKEPRRFDPARDFPIHEPSQVEKNLDQIGKCLEKHKKE